MEGGREGDGREVPVENVFCFQGYDIPAGHYLMLSPYWSHRDRDKFPDPESFKPVRTITTC